MKILKMSSYPWIKYFESNAFSNKSSATGEVLIKPWDMANVKKAWRNGHQYREKCSEKGSCYKSRKIPIEYPILFIFLVKPKYGINKISAPSSPLISVVDN